MVYPANKFDSHLRGDLGTLVSSPKSCKDYQYQIVQNTSLRGGRERRFNCPVKQ